MLQAPRGNASRAERPGARELGTELSHGDDSEVGAVRSLQPGRHPGHATTPCFAEKDGHVGSALA